jgi:uncharacterized protein YbjT (DUF2867 family)
MPNPLILVTGATGKTGAPVVQQLIQRGFPVRALVRSLDDRAARLEQLGAEVVVGDFIDLASMRRAMDGVERVYFVYPPQGDKLVEATAIAAAAAKDAGVTALVNMSQISAREDSQSLLARHHWQSEKIFDWAGIGAIHIRPTFFAEMLYILGAQSIAVEGKLYLPYGSEKHAPIAAADISRVVVGLLTDPAPYAGQRLILTGPRNMSLDQMAQVLTTELGLLVEYVDLPVEVWGEALGGIPVMTPFLAKHLQAVAVDHQNGVFNAETDVVERIGGTKPQSLAEFIRANREHFGLVGATQA